MKGFLWTTVCFLLALVLVQFAYIYGWLTAPWNLAVLAVWTLSYLFSVTRYI